MNVGNFAQIDDGLGKFERYPGLVWKVMFFFWLFRMSLSEDVVVTGHCVGIFKDLFRLEEMISTLESSRLLKYLLCVKICAEIHQQKAIYHKGHTFLHRAEIF